MDEKKETCRGCGDFFVNAVRFKSTQNRAGEGKKILIRNLKGRGLLRMKYALQGIFLIFISLSEVSYINNCTEDVL